MLSAKFQINEYTCAPRYYLPAGNNWLTDNDGCTICPENSYCPGGTYTFNETTAQGATKCPTGYDYNTDTGKTSVTQCQIHCDAGTYATGYTQLEYIEFTGTQLINIPTTYNEPYHHGQIGISFTALGHEDIVSFRGSGFYLEPNGNVFGLWATDGVYNRSVSVVTSTKYIVDYIASPSQRSIDVNGTIATGSGYTTSSIGKTIQIGDKDSYPLKAKIYYLKILDENGDFIADLIPVRRHSDGAIGMYDTVTETFFANSGTGDFVAGTDVMAICALCPENNYCPGETLNYGATTSNGKITCPTGDYAPAGMWEPEQCGRILHVGDGFVYLRSTKKTEHALNVDMDHDGIADYFGNMTTLDVPMSRGTQRKLKVRWDNVTYSIYDDSVDLSQYQN